MYQKRCSNAPCSAGAAEGASAAIVKLAGLIALETITGEKVHASANVKKNTVRLSARTTTLIQPMEAAIPPTAKAVGILAAK